MPTFVDQPSTPERQMTDEREGTILCLFPLADSSLTLARQGGSTLCRWA